MILLLAACTAKAGTAGDGDVASPFAACDVLTSAPSPSTTSAAPVSAVAASGAAGGAADLPDLALPCFSGGRMIRLTELRGPAVLNLWASWCGPCRAELPAMQRLAAVTTGRLHVIGVDSGDGREAAASFATDFGVTMPTLYDRDKRLIGALGRAALPVTVFVDAGGRRHVYNEVPPDDAGLAELVRAYAGVAVSR
jgi:thiol-disulfide isomerase/thioredoxin